MPAVPHDSLVAYLDENPGAVMGLFAIVTGYKNASGGFTETFYLSTHNYRTTDGNTIFDAILSANLTITESLSLDGKPTVSYGDLEIINGNGELDDWLTPQIYVWKNRTVEIYTNNVFRQTANLTAFKADSCLIFSGLIEDIDSRSTSSINFKLRDKLEYLNVPATDKKLGAYGTWADNRQNNEDATKPVIWGEVHNSEPLLINPATVEYMFHDIAFGEAESIIELRDNGVPIYTSGGDTSGANVNLTTGKLTLTNSLAGQLTASIQAPKLSYTYSGPYSSPSASNTYKNDIASLITTAIMTLGNNALQSYFTTDSFDAASFYEAQTTWGKVATGYWISDKKNLLELCNEIAGSVGAQLYCNSKGKIKLIRLGVGPGPGTTIYNANNIIDKSLAISKRSTIKAAIKLGYCKNWTVQDNLLTGIPQEHKDKFAIEWFTATAEDLYAVNMYKLSRDDTQQDTLLLTNDPAAVGQAGQVELIASYLLSIYSRPRNVYKFVGTYAFMDLELGDRIFINHNRFKLDLGTGNPAIATTCQIISISKNYLTNKVELEVLDATEIACPTYWA